MTKRINEHTRGLFAPDDKTTAVCLTPGTKVMVQVPETIRVQYKLPAVYPATFFKREWSGRRDHIRHRDSFRFLNGVEELLTRIPEGLELTIESIPQYAREDGRREAQPLLERVVAHARRTLE